MYHPSITADLQRLLEDDSDYYQVVNGTHSLTKGKFVVTGIRTTVEHIELAPSSDGASMVATRIKHIKRVTLGTPQGIARLCIDAENKTTRSRSEKADRTFTVRCDSGNDISPYDLTMYIEKVRKDSKLASSKHPRVLLRSLAKNLKLDAIVNDSLAEDYFKPAVQRAVGRLAGKLLDGMTTPPDLDRDALRFLLDRLFIKEPEAPTCDPVMHAELAKLHHTLIKEDQQKAERLAELENVFSVEKFVVMCFAEPRTNNTAWLYIGSVKVTFGELDGGTQKDMKVEYPIPFQLYNSLDDIEEPWERELKARITTYKIATKAEPDDDIFRWSGTVNYHRETSAIRSSLYFGSYNSGLFMCDR